MSLQGDEPPDSAGPQPQGAGGTGAPEDIPAASSSSASSPEAIPPAHLTCAALSDGPLKPGSHAPVTSSARVAATGAIAGQAASRPKGGATKQPWVSRRAKAILCELAKRVIATAVLLSVAVITAQLKLLALLSDDWSNFSWGVSQSLVAGAIVLAIAIPGAIRYVNDRVLLTATLSTMRQVVREDIAKIEADVFDVGSLNKAQLKKRTMDMLADAVRARVRLDKAIGRIEGAVGEMSEDIDT